MPRRSLPTRTLRDRPDLDQLRRQAKELLDAFAAGDPTAVDEVNAHYERPDPSTFALHDAQLVLARAYGFVSWPKLKAHVDGITVRRLVDVVRAGSLADVREVLDVRPELAHMSVDNLQVLHHAVLNRSPDIVRALMRHGANARQGVYPHSDATSPLTIATERGYDEIVSIIEEEERRQRAERSRAASAPAPDALFQAIRASENERADALLEANPGLARTYSSDGWSPLHVAARELNTRMIQALLDRGADATARGKHDVTPLDVAAHSSRDDTVTRFAAVEAILLERGAELTPAAAVALGKVDWLRARHAESRLINSIADSGGLLRVAASHNQLETLKLLLDFGFDPDERKRFEGGDEDLVEFTWGMPLWHCASTGKHAMAETLLQRGADPNAQVYASGTPLYQAYGRRDERMIALLERYGGTPDATVAGLYRRTELARQLVAGSVKDPQPRGMFAEKPMGEALLWAGACGGDPEIVQMALQLVDWPREDPRWFGILEQPLRIWNHGSGHWAHHEWDRGTYLTCFRLVLERCDPNVRGRLPDHGQFGLTILHSVAGSRKHVTAEERTAFATMLLDAGARLDLRDNLLRSTPLGWACRWGRVELVKLLLERGADPLEPDAEPWARPRAWAEKMGHRKVSALLRR
jgi:ankyrin repeat protein